MNKQIEDIARVLNECCNIYDEQGRHVRNRCSECEYWSSDNFCCCSYSSKEAEALYNAGYRRQDEVAREIFADVLGCLRYTQFMNDISKQSTIAYIAKLEKKYGVKKCQTN